MGPLVIKERFKETRVYSCGDTERRAVTKGTGGRHKSLSPNTCLVKKKSTGVSPHPQELAHARISTNEEKTTGRDGIFQVPAAGEHQGEDLGRGKLGGTGGVEGAGVERMNKRLRNQNCLQSLCGFSPPS